MPDSEEPQFRLQTDSYQTPRTQQGMRVRLLTSVRGVVGLLGSLVFRPVDRSRVCKTTRGSLHEELGPTKLGGRFVGEGPLGGDAVMGTGNFQCCALDTEGFFNRNSFSPRFSPLDVSGFRLGGNGGRVWGVGGMGDLASLE